MNPASIRACERVALFGAGGYHIGQPHSAANSAPEAKRGTWIGLVVIIAADVEIAVHVGACCSAGACADGGGRLGGRYKALGA